MRVPDLEQMIVEEYGPIPHPVISKHRAYFHCHVCGEEASKGDWFTTVSWWCEVCGYSAHYHERCVEYKDRIISRHEYT